jgi:hypothetical protein
LTCRDAHGKLWPATFGRAEMFHVKHFCAAGHKCARRSRRSPSGPEAAGVGNRDLGKGIVIGEAYERISLFAKQINCVGGGVGGTKLYGNRR